MPVRLLDMPIRVPKTAGGVDSYAVYSILGIVHHIQHSVHCIVYIHIYMYMYILDLSWC